MKPVILLTISLIIGVVSGGYSQLLPERLRGGSVYQNLLAKESQHHELLGFSPNTTKNWFDQLLDHTNPSLGTWKDKFYYDTTYWNGSGPCLMYLNGEGPLGSSVGGYMAELAQNFSACTLSIEHRFYGESLPVPLTNKKQFTTLLTPDQAMEDVMALIKYFESSILPSKPSAWILTGGSYSGGMTVWMNEKYPGFFKASWAASGVVKATFDYVDYDGHVKDVIPSQCSEGIKRIMDIASRWWDADPSKITSLFKLNPSLKQTKADFMWAMADAHASSVQYGQNTEMCNTLIPLPESDEDAMNTFQQFVFNSWGQNFMNSCYYSSYCLANPDMSDLWGPGGYSWVYECCSVFGWWQSGYPGSIRSRLLTSDYFTAQCQNAYYDDTYPAYVAWNKEYKGYQPVTQGHIIATQGSDDPWSTTGLWESPTVNANTFPVNTAQCTDCGHCGSMGSPSPSDPANLNKQRALVLQSLASWLQN